MKPSCHPYKEQDMLTPPMQRLLLPKETVQVQ
jgi:hypothetical protein